jgi:hypothetical protein
MRNNNTRPDTVPRRRDPDLVGAEAAMKRAAKKARLKASRLGTSVVVWTDGRVVEEQQSTATGE